MPEWSAWQFEETMGTAQAGCSRLWRGMTDKPIFSARRDHIYDRHYFQNLNPFLYSSSLSIFGSTLSAGTKASRAVKRAIASANRLKPISGWRKLPENWDSFHRLNPKWCQPLDFIRGFLMNDKKRTSLGLPARYSKGNVLGVLLNLDKMLGPKIS